MTTEVTEECLGAEMHSSRSGIRGVGEAGSRRSDGGLQQVAAEPLQGRVARSVAVLQGRTCRHSKGSRSRGAKEITAEPTAGHAGRGSRAGT